MYVKKYARLLVKVLCMFMHLLIILSLLLPIAKGMHYLGLLLVVPVLKVRAKVHHSLLKSQQKQLVKLPKSMVLRI
ncbi:hypothetical protein NELON_01435 [Neisseria elongata subsp. glycolytica ATCC 29315]|uniref:Uncharacterized protein n=1 Tax=Neisseria elongata subsp. glycolytica ATCC 29315 TaxID=546263 RepID=A0A0B5CN79_NEIEG|nr:hypothetical protein NELON_01435 [Neisseria elongata subsp. glycolytica ATCC 29315]OFT01675.1 hypothetical protein HMPREF3107_05720 [Neisseria sp. HMSC31F04]